MCDIYAYIILLQVCHVRKIMCYGGGKRCRKKNIHDTSGQAKRFDWNATHRMREMRRCKCDDKFNVVNDDDNDVVVTMSEVR